MLDMSFLVLFDSVFNPDFEGISFVFWFSVWSRQWRHYTVFDRVLLRSVTFISLSFTHINRI